MVVAFLYHSNVVMISALCLGVNCARCAKVSALLVMHINLVKLKKENEEPFPQLNCRIIHEKPKRYLNNTRATEEC